MTLMQISLRVGLAATLLLVAASARAQQEPAPSTAAPAAAAPATAAAPSTLAPEPAPTGPALSLEQRTTLPEQEARPQPFYDKLWFWGAIGLVLTVAAVILVTSAGSAGPATPNTTLGNMNAY
jgi:hypothetical protein